MKDDKIINTLVEKLNGFGEYMREKLKHLPTDKKVFPKASLYKASLDILIKNIPTFKKADLKKYNIPLFITFIKRAIEEKQGGGKVQHGGATLQEILDEIIAEFPGVVNTPGIRWIMLILRQHLAEIYDLRLTDRIEALDEMLANDLPIQMGLYRLDGVPMGPEDHLREQIVQFLPNAIYVPIEGDPGFSEYHFENNDLRFTRDEVRSALVFMGNSIGDVPAIYFFIVCIHLFFGQFLYNLHQTFYQLPLDFRYSLERDLYTILSMWTISFVSYLWYIVFGGPRVELAKFFRSVRILISVFIIDTWNNAAARHHNDIARLRGRADRAAREEEDAGGPLLEGLDLPNVNWIVQYDEEAAASEENIAGRVIRRRRGRKKEDEESSGGKKRRTRRKRRKKNRKKRTKKKARRRRRRKSKRRRRR